MYSRITVNITNTATEKGTQLTLVILPDVNAGYICQSVNYCNNDHLQLLCSLVYMYNDGRFIFRLRASIWYRTSYTIVVLKYRMRRITENSEYPTNKSMECVCVGRHK